MMVHSKSFGNLCLLCAKLHTEFEICLNQNSKWYCLFGLTGTHLYESLAGNSFLDSGLRLPKNAKRRRVSGTQQGGFTLHPASSTETPVYSVIFSGKTAKHRNDKPQHKTHKFGLCVPNQNKFVFKKGKAAMRDVIVILANENRASNLGNR